MVVGPIFLHEVAFIGVNLHTDLYGRTAKTNRLRGYFVRRARLLDLRRSKTQRTLGIIFATNKRPEKRNTTVLFFFFSENFSHFFSFFLSFLLSVSGILHPSHISYRSRADREFEPTGHGTGEKDEG